MKKLLKIIAGLLVVLLIAVIAVAVYITNFIDPNEYKPFIQEKVQTATGKKLNIDGELAWSFFPTLGIETGKIQLKNPAGFIDGNIIEITQAKLSLKVLPLFSGNIELGNIVLNGLEVHLERKADGQANWETPGQVTKKAPRAAPVESRSALDIAETNNTRGKFSLASIPDVDVSDVEVTYDDLQAGKHYALQNLNLHLKQANMSSAFPVNMSFDLKSNEPDFTGNVVLYTLLTANFDKQYFKVDQLKLTAKLQGGLFSDNKINFKTVGDMVIDGENKRVELNNGKMTLNNMTATASFLADGHANTFQGMFNLESFNLKQLLKELGQTIPTQREKNSLTKLSGGIEVVGGKNNLHLKNLHLTLDDSKLEGDVNLTDIDGTKGTFAFKLNKINLDNYLPKGSTTSASDSRQQVTPTANKPMEKMMFKAALNGTLDIGEVIINQLRMQNLHATVIATDNQIKLDPLRANLYGGSILAGMVMNNNPALPQYTTNITASNIDVGSIVKDATSGSLIKLFLRKVTGKAELSTALTTQGLTPEQLKKHLNGQGNLAIKNGVIEGIDLMHYFKMAQSFIASLGKSQGDTTTGANATQFASMTASFMVKDGVVTNNDLLLMASSFKADGAGVANLPANTINYNLSLTSQSAKTNPDGTISYQIEGDTLPLMTVTGDLDNPKTSLNTVGLMKSFTTDSIKGIIKDNVGDILKKLPF